MGILTAEELTQRVAVLRRFKTLLTQQRDRFRTYLDMLDKQQEIIESGSTDKLLLHVELEEKIVADIFSIQKVIDPLEQMYHNIIHGAETIHSGARDDEVPDLKTALENLKSEAVLRSSRNKELLSRRMVELRQEIKSLRNNPYTQSTRNSIFTNTQTATLVDIQG
jgi:uncharacterized protein (DUF849 family)